MIEALPLSAEGRVLFPGALGVWVGGNASANEDDAVLRLLRTRSRTNDIDGTDFGDFLLVSHIAAHRPHGLDPESAATLARNARAYSAFYPSFTTLTALDAPGFQSFFRMADSISRLPLLEQQLAWGQSDSLIEWVILLRRANALDDATAALDFRTLCDRFAAAPTEADRTLASFDLAKAILSPKAATPGGALNAGFDRNLRSSLAPDPARAPDFQAVLEVQKAPSLDAVLAIVSAAAAVTRSPASAPKALGAVQLPYVPIPADPDASREQRGAYLAYDPAALDKLIVAWNRNAAHPDPAETQRLAPEILKAAEAQVALALYAPLYATFFRSTDTAIARDPFLLRKHQFVSFTPAVARQPKFPSGFNFVSFGPFGTYLNGGFAHFPAAAGSAASTDWKLGPGSRPVMAENVGAMRAAPWDRLSETGQHLLALRILAAREWVVAAATDHAEYASLSDETLDHLSLYRRALVLHAIQERDWTTVWASFPLPDLFRVGDRYLARHPSQSASSETVGQLHAVDARAAWELDFFAEIPSHAHGCDHLHLLTAGPYEDDQAQNDPAFLAERTAELKLYLAERADSLGISPEVAQSDAEAIASRVFTPSPLDDYHDWRAMLKAYAAATATP